MIHPMHLIGLHPRSSPTNRRAHHHLALIPQLPPPRRGLLPPGLHFLPTCTSARTVPTLVIFLPPPLMGKP